MLNFSFSSVLMTVFVSNILLIAITLCFRNRNLLTNIGYKLLAVFCIVTLVRFLIPLELPFTKTIPLPETISIAVTALIHPYGEFLGIRLSIWTGFCVIWISGILILTVYFTGQYVRMQNLARTAGNELTAKEPYAALLEKLCTEKQQKRIRIFEADGIKVPMITGLRKPLILLPKDTDPYGQEILYALQHEICHYARHDLWLKGAVGMIGIAYWWNPFGHILGRQVDILLEMRVDDLIISKSAESAEGYIGSLLYYAQAANRKIKDSQRTVLQFSGSKNALSYRIHMMRRKKRKVNHLANAAMLAMVVSAYIVSYLFIFEGYYTPPDIADAYVVPSESSIFAIINEDGLYDIYMDDGFFLETTDSLLYYPYDMKIYTSKEEYHEKNP